MDTERAGMEDVSTSLVEVEVVPEGGDVVSSGSPWALVARTFAQNKLALLGVGVVVLVILFSFIGPLIYHTDQVNPNLASVNLAPGGGRPLGTDSSGFDILGRLMEGGQSSIEVGLAVGLFATLLGLIYGAVSGFFGGALDGVMMRLVDIGYAIPVVFLFIFMAQIFKPSLTLLIVLLIANLTQMVCHSVLVHNGYFREVARIGMAVVTAMTGVGAYAVLAHIDIVQFLEAYVAVYTCGAVAAVVLMIRGPIRLAHEVAAAPGAAPRKLSDGKAAPATR